MNGCGHAWRKIALMVAAIMVTFIQYTKGDKYACGSACMTMHAAAVGSKGKHFVRPPKDASIPGTGIYISIFISIYPLYIYLFINNTARRGQ